MTLRIVRLGTPRAPDEGLRIGTVRRPPRGVKKENYASEDWYDVWYPDLSPSAELMARGKDARTDKDWDGFVRAFRSEMAEPHAARSLDLLAALSHTANASVGCYCDDETRCHRSVLRQLLRDRGARIAS
ncbi:DUF488 domain-containing protein [Caulobacter sp. 17J80-11]|uniref:DUF488 domain-containing protein n=1 Tax=Caulobacter sp. 17J80-11 TaxID=2763502 RepID=UPI0016537564|nr:DUF488 family protein [Caulobacter sp. 17J80-11]MBC6981945.1 DUF488 family protein [Caulobacter sp. 17J80-11]